MNGQAFRFIFYSNALVGINGGFLDPRAGTYQSQLPGGQLCSLAQDGLRIGSRLVPYPPAWLAVLRALGISLF